MKNEINFLSTRNGFNVALNHFKFVTSLIGNFQRKNNLADLLNIAFNNNTIKPFQIKPIINAILVDKFKYCSKSINLKSSNKSSLSEIADKIANWDVLDFTMVYHHPQLGQVLINPKSKESWEAFEGGFKENELVLIYAGAFDAECDPELSEKGINALIDLIYGKKVSNDKLFNSQTTTYTPQYKPEPAAPIQPVEQAPVAVQPAPAAQSTSSSVKKKLSPEYGITVANELFHNGNVEAWKKIIESYETKYPDLKVLVFYDNEQIHDLNTLFKWGKVKHGTMILIRILGVEFKDISKLRRYLSEGASHKFETFLRGAPGQKLSLF